MRYGSDYIDVGTDYYERRDQHNREHLVATTSRLWPASACKLSSPSLLTAARRQL